jgi:hypothetical protein
MYEYTIGHADLDAAATTQVISLDDTFEDQGRAFPVDCQILGAWLRCHVDFSGGAVNALTCQVGDTGDPDELITATSLFTGASNVKPLSANGAAGLPRWEAAYAPEALFTSTAANLSALTAGSVTVCILVREVTFK